MSRDWGRDLICRKRTEGPLGSSKSSAVCDARPEERIEYGVEILAYWQSLILTSRPLQFFFMMEYCTTLSGVAKESITALMDTQRANALDHTW